MFVNFCLRYLFLCTRINYADELPKSVFKLAKVSLKYSIFPIDLIFVSIADVSSFVSTL